MQSHSSVLGIGGRMQVDFVQALRDIGREKDIPLETLSEIIEAALVSAYKKHHGAACEIHVDIDWDNGTATVFSRKQVLEHVENPHTEMALAEARRLDPTVEEGEYLDIEVTPSEFGRIAAQTAKQVVAQRIREAEREIIYAEFSNRDGDVVTGVVQRREGRTVFVDIGKVEAVLPASEQSHLDSYRPGDRLKVYILEVKRTTKTPRVLISRSHPGLIRRLFELEVPEVHEGIVEIKAQAREPGARSKVAVASAHENVDPVGACVGHRGSRVQAVVDELRGEKVDIVRWSEDHEKYVASALSPARVSRVIVDEDTRSATVVAPDNQLSLAIGREGQNVRLAARLTGWRIDIRSEAQIAEERAAAEQAAMEAASAEGSAPQEAVVAEAPDGNWVDAEAADGTVAQEVQMTATGDAASAEAGLAGGPEEAESASPGGADGVDMTARLSEEGGESEPADPAATGEPDAPGPQAGPASGAAAEEQVIDAEGAVPEEESDRLESAAQQPAEDPEAASAEGAPADAQEVPVESRVDIVASSDEPEKGPNAA